MPQSHGTRRRPNAAGRRTRSTRVPAPREAPEVLDSSGPGGGGPYDPYDPYGAEAAPGVPPEKKHRVRRLLTSNITIMVAAICALGATLVFLDVGGMVDGGTKPPKMAAADLSTNDMLARLSGSDMDKVAADTIAAAKKRAYEEHKRELARLKKKAKRDAAARAKLKAEQERERLAKMNPSSGQNKEFGKKMSAAKGWGNCWSSLLTLWNHESGWNERAENPSSGAYGIPQALPGSKLASAGSDWRTSSPTQIAWGLGYIKARYKDPCGAWAWWQAHNWY